MTQKVKQDNTKIRSDNGFKTIVILDDDRDITTTFKTILESDLISKHNIALRFRLNWTGMTGRGYATCVKARRIQVVAIEEIDLVSG